MNTKFKIKFLQSINYKKNNQGFTLIELLVVIIIIGVLAAIAVPNLLGQVAKGRQAEAKNNLGAWARAQQAYRLEYVVFTSDANNLPIKFNWRFYQPGYSTATVGYVTYYAQAIETYENDILDYHAGAMQTQSGNFLQVLCEEQSLNSNGNALPDFVVTSTFNVSGLGRSMECDPSKSKQVK